LEQPVDQPPANVNMTETQNDFAKDEPEQDLVDYMLLLAFVCLGSSVLFMNTLGVCPVDSNVVDCMVHYEPGVLWLLGLALVCAVLAARPVKI